MTNATVTRRSLLAAAPATAAAAAVAGLAGPAAAQAAAAAAVNVRRVSVGGFEVTTVSDGIRAGDGPHPTFGANVSADEAHALLRENGLPETTFANGFTPTIVRAGGETILFDTGLGEGARGGGLGQLGPRMAAAGVAPADVTVVVLTHMHPDHIGGLMEGGAPAFPNARYVTGQAEYDFWARPEAREGGLARVGNLVASNVTPLAERMTFVAPGDTVVPGVEAVAAFGHTPGHMVWHLESEGERLLITADAANHFVMSLQRPDWEVRFDMDKAAAAATRRELFGMLAADKVAFIGYHMPFPAIGYVEAMGEGFRYIPHSYQLDV